MMLSTLALAILTSNGCRCEDLDARLSRGILAMAAAVWLGTGRLLLCHNGRRQVSPRGSLHEQGRAIDFVLDGHRMSYTMALRRADRPGDATAWRVAGETARLVGLRWGLAAWGRADELGHFERPAGSVVSTWGLHLLAPPGTGCLL
jgi:hypothetical protein